MDRKENYDKTNEQVKQERDELLSRLYVALNDAMILYAHEFAGEEEATEAGKRMFRAGGTLAYFANLREEIRKVI